MNLKRIIFLTVCCTSILFGSLGYSQSVVATMSIPADTILIGQKLPLNIEINAPDNFNIYWPFWGDTLVSALEIVNTTEPEQVSSGKNTQSSRQTLQITSFDSGFYYIPAQKIQFSVGTDTSKFEALTNPLMLQVNSVSVDTTLAFKPIKGPVKLPITFAEILPWIIGILGIALLVFLVMKYFVNRSSRLRNIVESPKPLIPPYVTAMNELEQLRHQKLWQSGRVKEYYTILADIVRVYIEHQFGVMAVEMTTDEIMKGIKPLGINNDAVSKLAQSLELSDLVKFAKAQPSALENDLCLNHIIDFVRESHVVVTNNDENEADKSGKMLQTSEIE
jgi:hypothetical protein